MIAWAGLRRYKKKFTEGLNVKAQSRWPLDQMLLL